MGDAGRPGGGHRGLMLLQAPVALEVEVAGRDDQHAVGALESMFQRGLVVEVGCPDGDAERREIGEAFGIARGGDDARRRNLLRVEQMAQDAAAKLAGGAGDEKGFAHGVILMLCRSGECS